MNFKKYWSYFWYVVEHKKNVFIECLKLGLYIQAITHDLSKFRLSEFIPYANFFYDTDRKNNYKQSDESNIDFQRGWLLHQKRNKHHWNFWVSITRKDELIPLPMPEKYIKEMIADWNGMTRKFGGTTKEYFEKSRDKMILHPDTIKYIENFLDI